MNSLKIEPKISYVTFGNNEQKKSSDDQRKKTQQQVATGVGGAAGLSASTTKFAGKKGLKASTGEKSLQQMMESVKQTTQAVNSGTKKAKGLWGSFKYNVKFYTNDILTRLNSLKTNRFISPIINNVVVKKGATVLGGALAFFVLATGITKTIRTGVTAVDDLKNQYHDFKSAI